MYTIGEIECLCPLNSLKHDTDVNLLDEDKYWCTTCKEMVLKNVTMSSDYLHIQIEFPIEITVKNYHSKIKIDI